MERKLSKLEIESAKLRAAFRRSVKTLFDSSNHFLVRVSSEEAKSLLSSLKWKPHPEIENIIEDIEKIAKRTKKIPSNPYLEFDIGMEYSLVIYVTLKNGAETGLLDESFRNLSLMYSSDEYHCEQATPVSSHKFRLWWD